MIKEKGITLVALVVTIVILLLLAGVTLSTVLNENGLIIGTKKAVDRSQEISKQEEEKSKLLEEGLNDVNKETFNNKGVNRPALTDGMIPIKYKDGNWVITNENDDEWYEYKDVSNLAWANVMLSDGKYKWSQRNNKGAEGYYTDDGTTIVEEKDLGSMFVWIPRYAYSIKEYHKESIKEDGTTQGIIDVTFINGIGNRDFEGNTYETTYSLEEMDKKIGQATPKIVHPAFKNARGIWVAKFEASMEGTNENTATANDKVISNKLRVLPNVETWRYISIGNSFLNSFNMKESGNVYGLNGAKADTHLIKNTEWGAVAYLASSQYGYVPTVNKSNKKDESTGIYYSWAGGQDYETNVTQSTTNNVTGIYDLCGGSIEYVAAYFDNKSYSLKTYGKDVFNDDRTVKDQYKDYWEAYEVDEKEKTEYVDVNNLWNKPSSANGERMRIAKVKYENMKKHLGDAMYEVIGTNYSYYGKTTSEELKLMTEVKGEEKIGTGFYNKDYAMLGTPPLCFISRSGYWNDNDGAGVFYLDVGYGYTREHVTFRPTIVL